MCSTDPIVDGDLGWGKQKISASALLTTLLGVLLVKLWAAY